MSNKVVSNINVFGPCAEVVGCSKSNCCLIVTVECGWVVNGTCHETMARAARLERVVLVTRGMFGFVVLLGMPGFLHGAA